MNPTLRIFKDSESLSRAAAEIMIEAARQAIAKRGRFLVALSGGNTPMSLYRLLAQEPTRSQMDWSHIHVFWGDERCVPPDDPENSYGQAKQVFLDQVHIPAENVHRVAADLEPAAATQDYACILSGFAEGGQPFPRFDFALMGMGEDGHTASLFPGSPVIETEPVIAVTAHYQDRPANRVTLTPLVFNAARLVVFLVTGGDKAEILPQVLNGPSLPEQYPAQRIRPSDGQLIWLVDEAAAIRLHI